MSLLVTGTGTVGAQVIRAAVEKGNEDVIVFDIAPHSEFLLSIVGEKVTIERGSIINLPLLMEIIKNYNVKRIIHTAVVPENTPSIYETIHVNILGSANIFEAARILNGDRVINCSSCALYDFTKEYPKAPVSEEWPISSKEMIPYHSSKIAAEALASNYNYKYDVKIINVRLGGNYGPSLNYNMGDKLWMHNLISSAVKGIINFDTVATRFLPWTYAKDTADCLVHIAYSTQDSQQPVYNCAYPTLNGLNEMLDVLYDLIPGLKVNIKKKEEVGWSHPYDVSRIQNDFGYQFHYGLKESFADYIFWIKKNPLLNF